MVGSGVIVNSSGDDVLDFFFAAKLEDDAVSVSFLFFSLQSHQSLSGGHCWTS
jgi:hypothetical protein